MKMHLNGNSTVKEAVTTISEGMEYRINLRTIRKAEISDLFINIKIILNAYPEIWKLIIEERGEKIHRNCHIIFATFK
jgi:hypothetical protein